MKHQKNQKAKPAKKTEILRAIEQTLKKEKREPTLQEQEAAAEQYAEMGRYDLI